MGPGFEPQQSDSPGHALNHGPVFVAVSVLHHSALTCLPRFIFIAALWGSWGSSVAFLLTDVTQREEATHQRY